MTGSSLFMRASLVRSRAEAVQGVVLFLGVLVVGALAPADVLEDFQDIVADEAVGVQDLPRLAAPLGGEGEDHVLRAQVIVLER